MKISIVLAALLLTACTGGYTVETEYHWPAKAMGEGNQAMLRGEAKISYSCWYRHNWGGVKDTALAFCETKEECNRICAEARK